MFSVQLITQALLPLIPSSPLTRQQHLANQVTTGKNRNKHFKLMQEIYQWPSPSVRLWYLQYVRPANISFQKCLMILDYNTKNA